MLSLLRAHFARFAGSVGSCSQGILSSWRSPRPTSLHYITSIRAHRSWSAEEAQRLLQLRAEGYSCPEIATKLETRSTSSIENQLGRLRRKGLTTAADPAVPFSQAELQKLQRLRAQGLTFTAMLPQFPGRTAHVLSGRHNRIELGGIAKRLTPEEKAQVRQLREHERLTWAEIAERMPGCTRSRLSHYYCRATPLSQRVNIEPRHHHSKERLAKALRLRSQGMTLKDIGIHIGGISRPAVSSLLETAKNGTLQARYVARKQTSQKFTVEEDRKIVQLRGASTPWSSIAAEMPGRSAKTIQSRFRDLKHRGRIKENSDGTIQLVEDTLKQDEDL